jgi:hypothetical protein
MAAKRQISWRHAPVHSRFLLLVLVLINLILIFLILLILLILLIPVHGSVHRYITFLIPIFTYSDYSNSSSADTHS